MVNVNDQYDPQLRKLLKNKKHVAIIPVGSIEQHGPHLPITTDSEIVTAVAKHLSERENFLLLPTVTFGVSFEHSPFFNLSLTQSTLQKVLLDLIFSLSENKIKTIFVINGHHGNQSALKELDKKMVQIGQKIRVFSFSYWHFMKREFDHAGLVETSLMLALSKKVKMNLAEKGLMTEGLSIKEKKRLIRLASKSFPNVTKNGIWGDPTKATSSLGKKIFTEIVRNLEKKCQTCLTAKNPKLHQ